MSMHKSAPSFFQCASHGILQSLKLLPLALLSVACLPAYGENIQIDVNTKYQTVSGFGGMNITEPGEKWKIEDLTEAQAETAFGNDDGQLGLSILRIRVPYNSAQFAREVRTPSIAIAHGAKVFATPWSAPAYMKTNNSLIGGTLRTDQYGAYADHLLSFAQYLEDRGAPLYAISVQNEPDIQVDYESMDWNAQQIINFLNQQGSRFGDLKVIAPESFQMRTALMNPILNSSAAQHLDIVGGHIYGGGLSPYPLAAQKGKELWMTEHFTTSDRSGNQWPDALEVGNEVHLVMSANFNAYVWWYIRRSYGLITEDSKVSKRGYVFSQYSKFVRPGYQRIGANGNGLYTTAYQKGDSIVVVVVNNTDTARNLNISVNSANVNGYTHYTTTAQKNVFEEGLVPLTGGTAQARMEARAISTFVSYGPGGTSSSSSSTSSSSSSTSSSSSSSSASSSSGTTAGALSFGEGLLLVLLGVFTVRRRLKRI